ncbi:hypothetical protein B4U79_07859 [Dinothrombium tinctorium]|uniref:BPTI/Kunitz inhibitor domain-containing protein n=1 Tax=Dinothrombium tinctorium TaxID=1965070 RepID=A0A3S3NZ15_9ACAR|nr:hypothetical protein B4U79_05120 [Dinothrombium tinctorium]RWS11922.1 hypothetical protein B4U79_14092 [Dinothrombium tinctorium]RWS11970.1 hypothetical protein B4U79_07859 [Dinothrombium tinctorium]
MYSYNGDTSTCERFVYGGCDGTENRFENFELCARRCYGNNKLSKLIIFN